MLQLRSGTKFLQSLWCGALTLLAVAGLSGCWRAKRLSETEQIAVALNQFYANEPACLWQEMPDENAAQDAARPLLVSDANGSRRMTLEQASALMQAGLITEVNGRYTLTDEGKKAWHGKGREPGYGNLCYGYWRASGVENLRPRHDDLFGDVTEADFSSTVPSPAGWTRVPAMQKAFPLMALEVSRPLPHVATMKNTKKGWQVAAAVVDTAFP